jgi:hypothetical protein
MQGVRDAGKEKDSSATNGAATATATGNDVARRAYDLYLSRGREHGHDIEDWLQAEQELATLKPERQERA